MIHTILVAKLVGGPDTALARLAVDSVDKAVALRLGRILPVVLGVAQKTRGHARPEGEDNEGKQVAHGHGTTASLIQSRASGNVVGVGAAGHHTALAARGEVVEGNQEEDGSGDVDERVDAVDPVEQGRVVEEPLLDRELPEDVQALLEVDDLQSMLASDVDGALDESEGGEGASDLVDPVEKSPVPSLSKEGELLQDAAQQAVLEDESIGGRDDAAEAKDLQLAAAKGRDLVREQRRGRAGAPAVGRRAATVWALVGPLMARIAGPARLALPEVIVLVAVEIGTAEQESDDHKGFEKCADTHDVGRGWSKKAVMGSRRRPRAVKMRGSWPVNEAKGVPEMEGWKECNPDEGWRAVVGMEGEVWRPDEFA